MTTHNRREALAAGAGALVAIPFAVPAEADNPDAEVQRLIDRHRAAWLAEGAAVARLDELETAYREAHRELVLVPHSLNSTGGYEIALGRREIRKTILRSYGGQRQNLQWLSRLVPDLADKIAAAVDEAQRQHLELIDQCFAEEEARKEAFGLSEAQRRYDAAERAEVAALRALCTFPCVTAEGQRLRAEYLLAHRDNGCEIGEPYVGLLLRSMLGRAA
ncbi:MAG TPA: hypothetical protein VHG92_08515 [Afifellaceae bacterium]|nr:hypothetical protein [Afifellaceae bacterium]